jgi:hypothetical protein
MGAWLAFVADANIAAGVKTKSPARQLTLKAILNRVQGIAGFVNRLVRLRGRGRDLRIEVEVEPHAGLHRRCGQCRKPCPGYDKLDVRRWQFVPLWNLLVYFLYAPRRVQCAEHGVVVDYLPWSDGKRPLTTAMMGYMAQWALRLSWRETARVFRTSWESVHYSVEWFVMGLAHRKLRDIAPINVDGIYWGRGRRSANFLTVIY